VIPEGQHRILVDVTGRYFGINLQKKAEFKNQSLVESSRTKYLDKQNKLVDQKAREFASLCLDKGAQKAAALKLLKELEEEEMNAQPQAGDNNNHQNIV
jgi:hypothetical protein